MQMHCLFDEYCDRYLLKILGINQGSYVWLIKEGSKWYLVKNILRKGRVVYRHVRDVNNYSN